MYRNRSKKTYEIDRKTIKRIDIGIRRYIIKLNSGGGIKTTLSCAGHNEGKSYIKPPYLTMKFDTPGIKERFVKNLSSRKEEFKLNYFDKIENDLGINLNKDNYKTTKDLLKEVRKSLFESVIITAEETKDSDNTPEIPINYVPVKDEDNGYFNIHIDKNNRRINWEINEKQHF